MAKISSRSNLSACILLALHGAILRAEEPLPSSLASSCIESATSSLQSSFSTPTVCTSTPANSADFPSCDRVTRPQHDGGMACSSLDEREYLQLVQMNRQALKLIASRSGRIAAKASCLLGVPITPEEIREAALFLESSACDPTSDIQREFIVGCGNAAGTAAEFSPSIPYQSSSDYDGFAGAILFSPSGFRKAKSISLLSDTQDATAKFDFANSVVHENLHAIGEWLRIKHAHDGASRSNPPSKEASAACSLGSLYSDYTRYCTGAAGQPLAAGGRFRGGDSQLYWPYSPPDYLDSRLKLMKTEVAAASAKALAAISKRKSGAKLTDAESWLITRFEEDSRDLADIEAEIPCSRAYWESPNAYVDFDSPLPPQRPEWPECKKRPNGKFRDELFARNVSLDIMRDCDATLQSFYPK